MKLKANGIDINYEIEGDGPVVTFSHSLACNLGMWDDQVRALKGRYRVLRFDTRGHGQSGAPAGAYSLNLGGTPSSGTGIAYTSTGIVAGPIPAAGVNVHQMYVFGNEYYSVCELKGIQILRTPPGPQKTDELDQRRSIGWKAFFKAVITNEKFGLRIECESDFD